MMNGLLLQSPMAFAALCAVIFVSLLSVDALSVERTLPPGWTLKGCYTDNVSSRTLAGSSFSSANMTVEYCTSFCRSGGFSLAGVEFGAECYCDYALQSSGILANTSSCNEACSGASTELCGNGNFLDVYWNGTPPPTITPQTGTWKYSGCFADSPSSRQLPNLQTIPGGATVDSCTSACKSQGFGLAGLEYGQECWCGSGPLASSISDSSCATACAANTTEFCGGSNALLVYQDSTGQVCLSSTLSSDFNLAAVYATSHITGATSVPLHVVIIKTILKISWSVLTTGEGGWFDFVKLSNAGLLPVVGSIREIKTASLTTKPGDSPMFITTHIPPPAVGPYCAMANPMVHNGPQVLALSGRNDLWALCPNSTAGNRIDVVYSPVNGHAHYNKADCKSVYITINKI
ncbi:WSC domain-containing protein [Favolaschia claudopus]|uniref:WSC domain-containing protein n=1 Tax=Favolaschia claudopus TaxID=2862362 RepID=A0AAW0ECX3_9AGAR